MLIVLLAGDHSNLAVLADGLRAEGHTVDYRPMDASGALPRDGGCDAVLVAGPFAPPEAEQAARKDAGPCVVALLEEDDIPAFTPGSAFTDFAVAPFRPAEISLRIALHHKRQRSEDAEVIRSGSLTIDVDNYTVSVHNERIELTFKEYELLKFLVSHPGRVYTRESLLEQVWGYDYWGGSRTIDVHIRRIRSKLPEGTAAQIETVHQVGYRFAAR